MPSDHPPAHVLLFGATGTAGRGAARALMAAGHALTCVLRPGADADGLPSDARIVTGDISASEAGLAEALEDQTVDVVVSCLASRSGAPQDAWAVDHAANCHALTLAQDLGARQFILLSAICVQKPKLPFQQAKLAFEQKLIESGLTYSIVRPTAFFKSLSGQIDRLRAGKPFLVFGDGALTACTPISDDDLGRFIAGCISDQSKHNQILPIGGPGPALTPKEMGQELFRLLGTEPRFKQVPPALLRAIYQGLRIGGMLSPRLAEKAELARIGHYYATESMLVWDGEAQRYDRDQTPSTGRETLFDFYKKVIAEGHHVDLGDHSVF